MNTHNIFHNKAIDLLKLGLHTKNLVYTTSNTTPDYHVYFLLCFIKVYKDDVIKAYKLRQ